MTKEKRPFLETLSIQNSLYGIVEKFVMKFKYLIPSVLCLLIWGSCGMPFQDQQQIIRQRENNREKAITRYVQADLKIGERYMDYGFSREEIIKPNSFRKLDSLYEAMNQEIAKPSPNLPEQKKIKSEIELEKSKVLADTIHFLFKKEHFFGIAKNDSITFMNASFYLNPENQVKRVRLNYLFTLTSNYHIFYQTYINKTSFFELGMEPYLEELEFYNQYDGMLNSLPDDLQGNFLSHTIQIMRAAHQQKTLDLEPLIKQHIVNTIVANTKNYLPQRWSALYFRADAEQGIEEYEIDHQWIYTDKFDVQHEMRKTFILNAYLEIMAFYDTESVRP